MKIVVVRASSIRVAALPALMAVAIIAAPGWVWAEDRYIAPLGVGAKTGATLDDAAPFRALDDQISAAGPGGRVLFRTDLGPYSGRYHKITHGGATDAPVTLSGVDASGAEATVQVQGQGKPYFDLFDGANHLRFVDWAFTETGEGAIRIRGAISGLTLEKIDGTNLRQLIDTDDDASLRFFHFSGLTSSGFSKAFLGLNNAIHGIIKDSKLDSNWQDGDPIPEGIHIRGTSYDIEIRDVSIRNIVYSRFHNVHKYWNGDGIATERDTRDIKIKRVQVDGASDAGFDLKGGSYYRPHVIVDSTARNVKRGLRIWGVTVASDVELNSLTLPSVTLEDGTVLTQTEEAGPIMAIQLLEEATFYYRRVTLDGDGISRSDIERDDGAWAVKFRRRSSAAPY